MIALVTLQQVKDRLKFDHDEQDADLQALIYAASGMVLNYLKTDESVFLNSEGAQEFTSEGAIDTVLPEIQAATIYLVGILVRDTDGVEMEKWQHGYLPTPVTSMLYPLRHPALA